MEKISGQKNDLTPVYSTSQTQNKSWWVSLSISGLTIGGFFFVNLYATGSQHIDIHAMK